MTAFFYFPCKASQLTSRSRYARTFGYSGEIEWIVACFHLHSHLHLISFEHGKAKLGGIMTHDSEEPIWNDDQDVLAHLGYKQEFKRDFSHWELFGLSFSIVGVVQSIAYVATSPYFLFSRLILIWCRAVLLFSIPYGGPVGMIWGVRSPGALHDNKD
jgi:hypothetical protein